MVRDHGMTLPDAYTEPSNFDSKNLYCKVCDVRYLGRGAFTTHLRKTHSTANPPFSDLMPDMNDQNNYYVTCDKTYSTKEYYQRHLFSVHLDKLPELYQGIDCTRPVKYSKYCAD